MYNITCNIIRNIVIFTYFIQGLPGRSDNDVLDLDPTCQITRDLDDGESFLMNACRALRHSRTAIDGSCTKNAASVKRICRRILKHLNKGIYCKLRYLLTILYSMLFLSLLVPYLIIHVSF